MMLQEQTNNRRVLIIGTDGMRPDSVDPGIMPNYAKLMKRGTLFTSFYAAYPSETRVSMTTLTTGVYPGRHGVVSNLMYIPGFHEDGMFQTGNDKHLLSYRQVKKEPLILCPTLGDRLLPYGMRLGVAASSSPGASLLWNVNQPEQVINPSSWYAVRELQELHEQLGDVPDERSKVKRERALWATRALIDVHLKNPDNQVMVLWLSEPDSSQHDYGLGSPEATEALRVVDYCVSKVLDAVEDLGLSEQFDILLISDHGHSTVDAQGSLSDHLIRAYQELTLSSQFLAIGNYIYAVEGDSPRFEDVAQLIRWLQAQNWCEIVFTGDPKFTDLPGVLHIETLLGPIHHQRIPLIAVNPKWSAEANEFSVPGTVKTLNSSSLQSSHGTASPFDIHAFCMGVGPSFREGHVSDIPCGIIDIAPTVCHLLGLKEESDFDGRTLAEGLKSNGDQETIHDLQMTTTVVSSSANNETGIRISKVNDTRYILSSIPFAVLKAQNVMKVIFNTSNT